MKRIFINSCISFASYIKPQLFTNNIVAHRSCISFASYIKPQLPVNFYYYEFVVYLLHPTSNHNLSTEQKKFVQVVYLLHPTSNHNTIKAAFITLLLYIFCILHQTTTVTWSSTYCFRLYIFCILHQTTTWYVPWWSLLCCISFASYIKPQLCLLLCSLELRCISFASYIKPQRFLSFVYRAKSCISFASYIKPQRWICVLVIYRVVYLLHPTSNHNSCL